MVSALFSHIQQARWDGPAQGSQIPGADGAIPREGSKGRGQAPHDLGKERPLLMRAARPLGWP